MPLVAPDSPIRVRVDLDRRQGAQLDAIAVVANVLDLLYDRLVDALIRSGPDDSIEEFLPDAWGMIDWVHRMDGLVERCRGLSGRLPFVIDYRASSKLVESHRHAVQHLEGTIPVLEQSGRAPWGHMSWTVDLGTGPDGRRRFATRVMGSSLIGAPEPTFRIGLPLPPRTKVDNVSLYSGDGEAEISLTGQHESMVRFISALEAAVARSGPPGANGIPRIQ
jgi:hypothetical protein